MLAPLIAILLYRPLVVKSWLLLPRYVLPTALYGACVGLACSAPSMHALWRALAAVLVGAVGFCAASFGGGLIFTVMISSALVAVGTVPRFRKLRSLKHGLLRAGRVLLAACAMILSDRIPLHKSGDLFSDGYITSVFTTFLVFTYIPIVCMILYDAGANALWGKGKDADKSQEGATG